MSRCLSSVRVEGLCEVAMQGVLFFFRASLPFKINQL